MLSKFFLKEEKIKGRYFANKSARLTGIFRRNTFEYLFNNFGIKKLQRSQFFKEG